MRSLLLLFLLCAWALPWENGVVFAKKVCLLQAKIDNSRLSYTINVTSQPAFVVQRKNAVQAVGHIYVASPTPTGAQHFHFVCNYC